MVIGIFQQIDQYLLNQSGVHGNHNEVFRYGDPDLGLGDPLAEPLDRFRDYFFQKFEVLWMGVSSVRMRVMVSRFSTIFKSQLESS